MSRAAFGLLAAVLAAGVLGVGASPAGALGSPAASAAAAAPALVASSAAASSGKARRLRIRTPRGVVRGDVLVAGVTARARRIKAPAGWRAVRADGRGRLRQVAYVKVASASEPAAHIWRLRSRAAVAGGILVYRGIDAANPVAGHAGRLGTRRMPSPRLATAGPRVGFFGTDARMRLRPRAGTVEDFDVAARGRRAVSASGVHFTTTTSARATVQRRGRQPRARRLVAQLLVLRAAGSQSGSGGPAAAAPGGGSTTGAGGGGPDPDPVPGPGPGPGPGGGQTSPLPESTGAIFHVSTTGSDSNPGSAAQPWRTIQQALDALQPGQRAYVHEGVYEENLDMDRAGTAASTITVEAAPGERPVLDSAGSHPLEISSSGAYFRFRAFVIVGNPLNSGGNVDIYGHHVEISANEIRDSQDQGVYTNEESHHAFILGNWIHDNGEGVVHQSHGIYLQGEDHLVANNVIADQTEGFGIQTYDRNSRSTIVHNTIVGSGHAGIVVGGSGGVDNIHIHNNILAFNGRAGVAMDSSCPDGPVWIDHNVIFESGDEAVEDGCGEVDTSGGNLEQDPRFADTAGRDLHLQAVSPAIDYGDGDWARSTDHDGEARPLGATVDAGAYEDG